MAWLDAFGWDGSLFVYGAAAAMLALGVSLWMVGRGVPPRAFGAYLMLWGAGIGVETARNRLGPSTQADHIGHLAGIYYLAAGGALALLAVTYPRARGPFRHAWARHALVAATVAVVFFAILGQAHWGRSVWVAELGFWADDDVGWLWPLTHLGIVGPGFVAWLLAREPRVAEDRSLFLLALALAVYPLWRVAIHLWYPLQGHPALDAIVGPPDAAEHAMRLLIDGVMLAGGAFAVAAAARLVRVRRAATGRLPVGLVAFFVGAALVGLFLAFVRIDIRSVVAVFGLVTLFLPAVATYALLRGDLLGLDLKVRFALSKSTVAAAFVAAFFVASEGAQLVFGAENQVVGLVAAGALVFAIAPLQRAADRLAERAVPVAEPADPAVRIRDDAAAAHARAYRAAVRAALRDGVVTPREEEHLAEVAQELGIGAKDALRMRREVEAASAEVPR